MQIRKEPAGLNLKGLTIIRIIVNQGRGSGHQSACNTLMERLRELGFEGDFDIRYEEYYPRSYHTAEMVKEHGSNGKKLAKLINGFKPAPLGEVDQGTHFKHPSLGNLSITRLPYRSPLSEEPYNLPSVTLTMTGADDRGFQREKAKLYNSDVYIGLEPTDWELGVGRFIASRDGNIEEFPKNLRLSSSAASKRTSVDDLKLSDSETLVHQICSDKNLNSQLVYGLYPDVTIDSMSNELKQTGHLAPKLVCWYLIKAHKQLGEEKPTVLLFPQEVCKDSAFREYLNQSFDNLIFVDLTDKSSDVSDIKKIPKYAIIIAYTGFIQPDLFNFLMLQATTFPAVIEGCNSREVCEFSGKAFIQGGRKYVPLIQYEVDPKLKEFQDLQVKASSCLGGNYECFNALVEYISASITGRLVEYNKARQTAFLERPDACEYAISFELKKKKIYEATANAPILFFPPASIPPSATVAHTNTTPKCCIIL